MARARGVGKIAGSVTIPSYDSGCIKTNKNQKTKQNTQNPLQINCDMQLLYFILLYFFNHDISGPL